MCNRPITNDGKTFSCRTCDACIATRRHNWVARAMAEKAMHPHTLVVALTYDNSTQANRDAAAMFQYADITAFLKRLRRSATYRDQDATIRFICAGEQGDRNGRCHWHCILYSSVDLATLGTIQGVIDGKKTTITDPRETLSIGKAKKRLSWSLWPHGMVTFQQPDQGGMHYVLSYCLKDQFTDQKSHETKRQAKVENFATGLFRMSKRPAIGAPWLWAKLRDLETKGATLPSLNLKVPGFHGYYHPSGSFRQSLLWSLVALNKRHVWATGRNTPQWTSLLASLQDNPPDLEILNGQTPEQQENAETLEHSLAKKQREYAGHYARREHARACGNQLACEACLSRTSDHLLSTEGVERFVEYGVYSYRSLPGFAPVEQRQRTFAGKSHPFCQKRGSTLSRHTFPDTDRTTLKRS